MATAPDTLTLLLLLFWGGLWLICWAMERRRSPSVEDQVKAEVGDDRRLVADLTERYLAGELSQQQYETEVMTRLRGWEWTPDGIQAKTEVIERFQSAAATPAEVRFNRTAAMSHETVRVDPGRATRS